MNDNEVIGYNPIISEEEAQEYLTEDVIFIEGFTFNYEPPQEGYRVKITLDESNTPHYEYIELEKEETTQLDRIETLVNQNQTELIESAIDEYTLELIEQGVL